MTYQSLILELDEFVQQEHSEYPDNDTKLGEFLTSHPHLGRQASIVCLEGNIDQLQTVDRNSERRTKGHIVSVTIIRSMSSLPQRSQFCCCSLWLRRLTRGFLGPTTGPSCTSLRKCSGSDEGLESSEGLDHFPPQNAFPNRFLTPINFRGNPITILISQLDTKSS